MSIEMKAGWYAIDPILGIITAAHTYCAIAGRNGPWFDCYGGHSGPDNHYPVKHNTVPDSKRILAVTICCFNPKDSRANKDSNFNKKTGGELGTGDSSCILYGVTGVCHQMCNRILWAVDLQVPSNTPGYIASRTLYGTYGGAAPIGGTSVGWEVYKKLCEKKASGQTDSESMEGIENMVNPEQPTHSESILNTIWQQLGKKFDEGKTNAIEKQWLHFVAIKADADNKLSAKRISRLDHASIVNKTYSRFLHLNENILSTEEYKKLWGHEPGGEPDLIDLNIVHQIIVEES